MNDKVETPWQTSADAKHQPRVLCQQEKRTSTFDQAIVWMDVGLIGGSLAGLIVTGWWLSVSSTVFVPDLDELSVLLRCISEGTGKCNKVAVI